MISNVCKKFLIVSAVCSFSSVYCAPTHAEIVEEIAHLRKSIPQFQDGTDLTARYYLDRVNEATVLDATTSKLEYIKKYITMYFPVEALRNCMGGIVLLTKDNAPKLYESIEIIAQKVGLSDIPLIYLVEDERFFNAFASGIVQSLSIVVLGEKIIKELPGAEALEFLIAHELSHIKKYDVIKRSVFALATWYAIDKLFACCKLDEASTFYYPIYSDTYGVFMQTGIDIAPELILPYLNTVIKGLVTTGIAAWYFRFQERRADTNAAHVVGARGGVDLSRFCQEKFEHVQNDYAALQTELEKTSLKNSRIFQARVAVFKAYDAIAKFLGKPFSTHPEYAERIAYLEELAKEQEAARVAQ